MIAGQDIVAHQNLHSAVFPRALREHGEGRFLQPGDEGQPNIVISRKIASEHPDAQGKPKKVGDTLQIGGKPFKIVGIYETGSMLLDVVIIMDIETARSVLNRARGARSCIYVEGDDPARNDALAAAIEKAHPGFDARSMDEAQANFSSLMGQIDTFLLMTVSLALAGRDRRDHQHDADEHDRAVRRVRRAPDQRLVAGQYPDPGDARERLSRPARRPGRLRAGLGWHDGGQPVHLGGYSPGDAPSLLALGIGLSVVTGTLGGFTPPGGCRLPMEAIRSGRMRTGRLTVLRRDAS